MLWPLMALAIALYRAMQYARSSKRAVDTVSRPSVRLSLTLSYSGHIQVGWTGYSQGFLGDEASNDSGVIKNVDFQGFRTLRLRHLRK